MASRTSSQVLAAEPGREIVLGTLVAAPPDHSKKLRAKDFKTLRAPGFVLAVNFLVSEAGPGEFVVSTETRVYATDAPSRRKFACYWRVIYPGSALIRCIWLRAIKRRAERSPV